jgi:hypothetical protein
MVMSTRTLLHQAARLPERTRRGGKERALMAMEVLLAVGAYGGGADPAHRRPAQPRAGGRDPAHRPGRLAHVTVGAVLAGWMTVQVAWIGLVAPASS